MSAVNFNFSEINCLNAFQGESVILECIDLKKVRA